MPKKSPRKNIYKVINENNKNTLGNQNMIQKIKK